MSGKRSRTKGIAYERDVAQRLSAVLGTSCVRVLRETRDGNSGDIDCPGYPLSVQCKIGQRPNPWKAVAEAKEVADKKKFYAIAFTKKNGAGPRPAQEIASMPASDLLEILEMLKESGMW